MHARFEGEDTRIVRKDGTILFDEDAGSEGSRPEIDRGKLCDIIIAQINPTNIKYGYKYEKLIQHDNRKLNSFLKMGRQ